MEEGTGFEPQPLPRPLPDILIVERLLPDIEQVVFHAASAYVEVCYLPILGPTATWLYRRLAGMLAYSDFLELESVCLAQEMGVGTGNGKNSRLWSATSRLVRFEVAHWVADRLLVTMAVPPLSPGQRSRLTTRLLSWERWLHQHEVDRAD